MAQPADLVITNARVYTVAEAQPAAEAVAVRGNTIVFDKITKGPSGYTHPDADVDIRSLYLGVGRTGPPGRERRPMRREWARVPAWLRSGIRALRPVQ